jgi:transposase, IS5 family
MLDPNNLVLQEFAKKGLLINEGIAVDARLVKSASKPLSKVDMAKLRKKRNTPEGKLDKNSNPLKFCRDVESNWLVQNEKPHFGLKKHASVDFNNGFILATNFTPASESDSIYLPYLMITICHTKEPIKKV